jgi:hypothetical protein
MTTPVAKVLQRDIARALREAKKHGAKRVHVDLLGGGIDIFLTDGQVEVLPEQQHPTPPSRGFHSRPDPKQKVVL